jgi:LPS-assembly protein
MKASLMKVHSSAPAYNRSAPAGILAQEPGLIRQTWLATPDSPDLIRQTWFATLPATRRRANFTLPRLAIKPPGTLFEERRSADFLPMTLRNRFLITALFLCHQLLAPSLVTRQLLAQDSPEKPPTSTPAAPQIPKSDSADSDKPCANRATTLLNDGTIICAVAQEKIGDVYKLHGSGEIHYHGYIIRADEITYNSDSGETTADGHFSIDGGPVDEHIKASHGTYNVTAETGRFYDVTATTGFHFHGRSVVLTSTAPFAFTGKVVEKDSPDHYLVFDGTITTCELPHPKWQFDARKVSVDVGGNAQIYSSSFWLYGLPVFYFPYATHPVDREARETGFLVPTVGRSSTNGNEIGEGFYWAINRSLDAMVSAEYFSKRGWSERGEFRARPSDTSFVDLTYFGVIDRGISQGVGLPPLREGGEEARLLAEGNFRGFRAVSNIDYLSAFIFRLAFNDIFTQAVNSEVKSQVFLARAIDGFSLSTTVERYQNFFQLANSDGSLTNPPVFDNVQIWHDPSADISSLERQFGRTPLYWSFDASLSGLGRSEPGFHTGSVLGRFILTPEISAPLLFGGWTLRPALTLHEAYYTERFVGGLAVNDPTNRQALEGTVEVRPPTLEKIFDREILGRKWKHVIEPRAIYRIVTGVNDFAQVLHFDDRDILSNTHEVEYGFVTRLYAKRTSPPRDKEQDCATSMTGLAVGAAAPEQLVPWQHITSLENPQCAQGPNAREVLTWELAQKYFIDPNFGGALVPGQRNVFTTTEDLTGIAFATEPRHLSPLVSRLRAATGSHTDTEWDLDYDFQLGRINASTLLFNYNFGPFTLGAGDAFLQIPQQVTAASGNSIPTIGQCTPISPTTTQSTCRFQQFRVGLGYGGLNRRGFSAATSMGFDTELGQLQFATAQTTYNWDCCGMTLEYRRYAIANVRNENLFRFTFTLANIGSLGNLRRQERLY